MQQEKFVSPASSDSQQQNKLGRTPKMLHIIFLKAIPTLVGVYQSLGQISTEVLLSDMEYHSRRLTKISKR
jgi:hypothetical protein